MDGRKSRLIKLGIPAAVAVIFLVLLFIGKMSDSQQFDQPDSNADANPYIEISPLNGEQVLVGDVVVEWLKGEQTGKELYDKYVAGGKVYAASPVTLNYAIYDMPTGIEVKNQLVELSLNSAFEDAAEFELVGNKRSVRFDYLLPDKTYYFRITANLNDGTTLTKSGQFVTADTPRIISTDGVWNMRDIGGVETLDGKKMKLGMVYRGVELDGAIYERYCITPSGAQVLTEQLGIKAEIDLRDWKDNMRDMLGSGVKHNFYGVYAYEESLIEYYYESYRVLFSDLAKAENYPMYVHCTYGKDRTGTVIYLLQVLCGVSEEDAYKEWELSVLLDGHIDYNLMDDYIEALKEFEGDTMQQKVESFLFACGVTQQEIDSIREILLED